MKSISDTELLKMAENAADLAYSPYSGFSVGAALLTESGKVYLGCNIENASFSPTVCAERVAVFKAISEGEKVFSRIAVVGKKDGAVSTRCTPCGVCRQVLSEFCSKDFKIIIYSKEMTPSVFTIEELLPSSFGSLSFNGGEK